MKFPDSGSISFVGTQILEELNGSLSSDASRHLLIMGNWHVTQCCLLKARGKITGAAFIISISMALLGRKCSYVSFHFIDLGLPEIY